MTPLDAYRGYQQRTWFRAVNDAARFEAYVRDLVVIQADGSVRQRMPDSVMQAVLNSVLTDRRDYSKVRSPALAIYAESYFDTRNGDSSQSAKNLAWEEKYIVPFRAASKERIRRELRGVEIVNVPGTHKDSSCRGMPT